MNSEKVCYVTNSGFVLDVVLFSNATSKDTQLDFLGSTIKLGKPVVRQLLEELKTNNNREILVPVVGKEYLLKISVDRYKNNYRIMDNERTITLGLINDKTLDYFAGESDET